MKNIRIISLAIFVGAALAVAGCATSTVDTQQNLTQKTGSVVPLEFMTLSDVGRIQKEDCPQYANHWQNLNLKELIQKVNACAALKKWDQVRILGQFMSQKFYGEPWGPYYQALAAHEAQSYPLALWMIELSIKKSPRMALLYYERGRIYWSMAEYSRAIESYRAAVNENPKLREAQLFLAQLYFRDRNFKMAANHYAELIKYYPQVGAFYAGLAESQWALNEKGQMISLYLKALESSPLEVAYRTRLAWLYEHVEKNDAMALQNYKQASVTNQDRLAINRQSQTEILERIQDLESRIVREVSKEKEKRLTQSEEKVRVKK